MLAVIGTVAGTWSCFRLHKYAAVPNEVVHPLSVWYVFQVTIQANEPTAELTFANEKLVILQQDAHNTVYIEIFNVPKEISEQHCKDVMQEVWTIYVFPYHLQLL